jgi:hypothetical protein
MSLAAVSGLSWSLTQVRSHSSRVWRRLAASSDPYVAEPHRGSCVLASHPQPHLSVRSVLT